MSNSKSKFLIGLLLDQVSVRLSAPPSVQPGASSEIEAVTEQPAISSDVVLVATAGYEAPAPKLANVGECTVNRPLARVATVSPPGRVKMPDPPGVVPMAMGGSAGTPPHVVVSS